MRFPVSYQGRKRIARLTFGQLADARYLTGWRLPTAGGDGSGVRDALEFRKLATKRWRYYLRVGEAATSLAGLRRRIAREPGAEIGMLLLAKAPWHLRVPVLGCCFCRRSWCHHLIVDFLAVHPCLLVGGSEGVRGVDSGVLYSIVRLADHLGIGTIWGEATQNSAGFYEKVLNLPKVTDHFFIRGNSLDYCRGKCLHWP